MIDGESNFISTQAINMIYYKTKPDWAEGDLHNNRREGSLDTRHLVSSQQSEPITIVWNHGTTMSGHKPSNSQLQSSWTSRLYCILYFPASFKMSGTTHLMAEQHILEYMNFCFLFLLAKDTTLRVSTSFTFQPKFSICITYIQHFKSEWNVFWYNWHI
jgi:hypothetical protein